MKDLCVLQLIPALDSGGAERTTVDIVRALSQAGARALVASQGGRLVPDVERAGGRVILLPLKSKNALTMISNGLKLERLIRTAGISLVHARSRAPAWSGLIAARRARVPFLTTYHGLYSAKDPLKRWYNGVMAKGDRVIANSAFTARHILDNYPGARTHVAVIPRGVDLQLFDPARIAQERIDQLKSAWRIPDGAQMILVPGRVTAWKGQDLVIDALSLLRERGQGDHLILVFAGDIQSHTYRDELTAKLAQLRLADRARLAGHCADMPAAYAAAALVVQPSRRPEAFGRVAAEAQAMGAVVIASDIGAASETIMRGPEATGFLFPPDDPKALAHAIAQALAQPQSSRRAMVERAIAHVRARFSLAQMCADTLSIYAELTGPRA